MNIDWFKLVSWILVVLIGTGIWCFLLSSSLWVLLTYLFVSITTIVYITTKARDGPDDPFG